MKINKKWWLLLIPIIFLSIILVIAEGCIRASTSGKYNPSSSTISTNLESGEIKPEKQTEGHLCGLHSMEAIYKSYSLEPENFELRFRLGVDEKANPLDKTSTGSIHPDLLRVLNQDGFSSSMPDPKSEKGQTEIRKHIENGFHAIALISKKQLHWLVLTKSENEQIKIIDSLSPEINKVPLDRYLTEKVHSIILVQPGSDQKRDGVTKSHIKGAKEMLKTNKRLK